MKRVAKIQTTRSSLETVYKEEKDNGVVVHRLERASINGHDLPPIEVRKDRKNITVRSVGSATVDVHVNEVTHFSGKTFPTVQLEQHTPNVGGRNASGHEARSIQKTRMYRLCKYAVGAIIKTV